jgi:hypothetical protein
MVSAGEAELERRVFLLEVECRGCPLGCRGVRRWPGIGTGVMPPAFRNATLKLMASAEIGWPCGGPMGFSNSTALVSRRRDLLVWSGRINPLVPGLLATKVHRPAPCSTRKLMSRLLPPVVDLRPSAKRVDGEVGEDR